MTPGAVAILSLSMSTDAFAAAVGRGAAHRPSLAQALRAGLIFGSIEAATPVIGWSLGLIAAGVVQQIDHWIAFVLLAGVGAHMVWHGVRPRREDHPPVRRGLMPLIATAVGTSIDAAAVGVGLAFIGVNIWAIALSIGLTTFALTTLGMLIGARIGVRTGKHAEILGGLALIAIGAFILAEHMGWIAV
jgi:manganese efflux pump family protein